MDKEEKEFIHIRLSSFGEGEEREESEPDEKWSNFNCLSDDEIFEAVRGA